MTDESRDLSAVEIAKLEGRMDQGFAELGGKLDTLIAKQQIGDDRYHDHETRIRYLERLIWKASGAATVMGAIAGYGASRLFG